MHIEPGLLTEPKLVFSDSAAIVLLGTDLPIVPIQAGPSELRFIGVTPIYLAFGFISILFASSYIPLVVEPLVTFLILWVLKGWGETRWEDVRFIEQPILKTRIAS